jgi:hypothetical protein
MFSWWRGAVVVAAWVVWPFGAFVADTIVRFMTSTSRGCSIEGCTFTPNAFELAIYFLPPLAASAAWWRWRRSRAHSSS